MPFFTQAMQSGRIGLFTRLIPAPRPYLWHSWSTYILEKNQPVIVVNRKTSKNNTLIGTWPWMIGADSQMLSHCIWTEVERSSPYLQGNLVLAHLSLLLWTRSNGRTGCVQFTRGQMVTASVKPSPHSSSSSSPPMKRLSTLFFFFFAQHDITASLQTYKSWWESLICCSSFQTVSLTLVANWEAWCWNNTHNWAFHTSHHWLEKSKLLFVSFCRKINVFFFRYRKHFALEGRHERSMTVLLSVC